MPQISSIQKILVISLSNIGDIILTFPVIDALKEKFPAAQLDIVVGPKGTPLLSGNPEFPQIFIFDKRQPALDSLRWLVGLRRQRYDLVVDLRNSAIPLLAGARQRTSFFLKRDTSVHMREQHLKRLRSVVSFADEAGHRHCVFVSEHDRELVQQLAAAEGFSLFRSVVVAPGAADHNKRWSESGFARVCDHVIARWKCSVIFVGGREDSDIIGRIRGKMRSPAADLSGRISLTQLGFVLQACRLAIVNDSAPMHLASYLDVPVVGLFGPTDPRRYGPWSSHNAAIRQNAGCPKCRDPRLRGDHECMAAIDPQDVMRAVESLG